MFEIKIDKKTVYTLENTTPCRMKHVKVYAGDPWVPPVNGKIRNIKFTTYGSLHFYFFFASLLITIMTFF